MIRNIPIVVLSVALIACGIRLEMLDRQVKSLRQYVIRINMDGTVHNENAVAWKPDLLNNNCEVYPCAMGWCGTCKSYTADAASNVNHGNITHGNDGYAQGLQNSPPTCSKCPLVK